MEDRLHRAVSFLRKSFSSGQSSTADTHPMQPHSYLSPKEIRDMLP